MMRILLLFLLIATAAESANATVVVRLRQPIDRAYEHVWRDQMQQAVIGDLVLGRRNYSSDRTADELMELYVGIYPELSAPPRRPKELVLRYVGAIGHPLAAQLRDVDPNKLAELDAETSYGSTYSQSSDPIMEMLSFESGEISESQCPVMRSIFETFDSAVTSIRPGVNLSRSGDYPDHDYFARSISNDGLMTFQTDRSSRRGRWIAKSLNQLERCIEQSREAEKLRMPHNQPMQSDDS